jgi:hypothetical protein
MSACVWCVVGDCEVHPSEGLRVWVNSETRVCMSGCVFTLLFWWCFFVRPSSSSVGYPINISRETLLALEEKRYELQLARDREKQRLKLEVMAAQARADQERLTLELEIARLKKSTSTVQPQ